MDSDNLSLKKTQNKNRSEHCGVPICSIRKNTAFGSFVSKSAIKNSNQFIKQVEVKDEKIYSNRKAVMFNSIMKTNITSAQINMKKPATINNNVKSIEKSSVLKSKPGQVAKDDKSKFSSLPANKPIILTQKRAICQTNKEGLKKGNSDKSKRCETLSASTNGQKQSMEVKKKTVNCRKQPEDKSRRCEALCASTNEQKQSMDVNKKTVNCRKQPEEIFMDQSKSTGVAQDTMHNNENRVPLIPSAKTVHHTPQPVSNSSKKFIYKDMKHSGVFITPKPKSTSCKDIFAYKTPKEISNKYATSGTTDTSISGIELLSQTDENQHRDSKRTQEPKYYINAEKGDRSSATNIETITSIISSLDNYTNICQTIDGDFDEKIVQSYEEILSNYEAYCEDIFKLFQNILENIKLFVLPQEEDILCKNGEFIDDRQPDCCTNNLNDFIDQVQTVARIIGENVDEAKNSVASNDCGDFIETLKRQKSMLEQKLIKSDSRYNRLQQHLETTTSDALKNVIIFEKTAISCLNFLQRQIEVEKYENIRRSTDKDEEILRLKNVISDYQLRLQEFEDDVALLKAEKENLEDVIECRSDNERTDDEKTRRVSFFKILTELTFATRHAVNLDPAYKNFYLRFFEFIREIKWSVTSLNLDFYLSLPVITSCQRCSALAVSSSSTNFLPSKVKETKNSSIEVENIIRFVNMLTDKIRRLKRDELEEYLEDDDWKQLLSDNEHRIDNENRLKLNDAYSKMTKELSDLKVSVNFSKCEQSTASPEKTTADSAKIKNDDCTLIAEPAETSNYKEEPKYSANEQCEIKCLENDNHQNVKTNVRGVLKEDLKNCLEIYETNKENNPTMLNTSTSAGKINSPLKIRDINTIFLY